MPRALHERVLRPLAERMPVSHENFSLDFKIKRFLRGAGWRPELRDQVWIGSFTPEEQRGLFASPAEVDDYEDIQTAEKHCSTTASTMERLIYLYCKFYLQDDILVKVDRASMACALEARAPFLDYTFVEFVNAIPFGLKLKGLKTKYILKRAMAGRVPPDILARGKKGFGIPIAKWFRNELRDLLLDTLSERRIKQQGIFDYPALTRLVSEHLHGVKDNRKQLWTVFMFQLWFEKYMGNRAG
jgi:asparagine synthase (glutamine-hydrolysing)